MRWFAVSIWMGMTASALGQPPERYPITVREVTQSLQDRGVAVSDAQVSLAAAVVATVPAPALDAIRVEPQLEAQRSSVAGSRSWYRLSCHVAGSCLPFYAIVSGLDGSAIRRGNSALAPSSRSLAALGGESQIKMNAGTHATLILDDHRSQIRIAVVSLDNGVAGRTIRVASLDRKRVYLAEVVTASLLKGSY